MRPRRIDFALLAIILMAVAFRLYRLDAPYVDAHSWRQVTNADVARLWTEQPINMLYPPVSWGGRDGYVGMELPLIQALAAIAWRVGGHSEPLGRLVPLVFSVASVWLIYLLGTRLFDRPTGRAAAFLLAFSPTYVYFGRTLLSDVPMVCFSIAAVLGYAWYFRWDGPPRETRVSPSSAMLPHADARSSGDSGDGSDGGDGRAPGGPGRRRWAVVGAVCLALAGLVKIPAILILGPIVWMAWLARGWRALADWWFTLGVAAAFAVIAAWYLHADRIYLDTGLTQAIFRPSGQYAGLLAIVAGPFTTVSHWTVWSDPRLGERLFAILERFWELHLTPVGFIGAAIGLLRVWTPARRTIVDVWLLAGLALLAVSIPGQFNHEFHQLPLLPPIALYFGMAAAPLFDGVGLGRLAARLRVPSAHTLAPLAAALIWGVVAWASFVESPIFIALYRPRHMNIDLIVGGRAIGQATPPDALLVTAEYARYGTNSPMLLYYAQRRGWSFDATAIRPDTIRYLRERAGACYFATSHWTELSDIKPDVAEYLRQWREIPLENAFRDYRLFDLGCAR